MASVLSWAKQYLRAGFSVFPIRANGEKAPAVQTWTPYQQRLPTEAELESWFEDDTHGIAIVCGPVSGGLVVMDFETEKAYTEWLKFSEPLAEEIDRAPLVITPSGGRHLYLRCQNPPRNLKLARDESGETSIETRGGGGYVLAPGSPAACHEANKEYEWVRPLSGIVVDTDDVVSALLDIGRSLDRSQKRVSRADAAPPPPDGAVHPGHRYTAAVSWSDVLEPHGWEAVRTVGGVTQWRRPGKNKGLSATTGFCKGDKNGSLLFVFSTNADPFEAGVTYSKFAAYALLNHGGDWRKAAKQLAEDGYGAPGEASASFSGTPSPTEAKEGNPGSGSDAEFWSHDKLLGAKFSAVRYIVHELIADESLTIFGGAQKTGKTWAAIQIAQAVAAGQDVFGRRTEAGDVIYLALEDGSRRLQDRLMKQKSPGGLPILWYTKFPKLDGKDGWPLLCDLAARRPRLLVVDTLSAAKSGKTDESDSGQMADLFNGLRELAQRHQIAILVVHHHGKTVSGDPAHDLRGSSAIGAAADVLLGLYRIRRKDDGETPCDYTNHDPATEGTPDFFLKARGRDIEDVTFRLRFGAKEDWIWKVVDNENDGRKVRAVMNRNAVEAALRRKGPLEKTELATETGLHINTVDAQIAALGELVKVFPRKRGRATVNVYYMADTDAPQR